MKEAIQILCSVLGSCGFALLFNVKLKWLFHVAIGGAVCWAIFLLMRFFNVNIFFASVASAAACALYGEVLARILKAPTTVFMVPSVIPLIPGSSLYYTMQYAVLSQWDICKAYALETVLYIGAISLGLSFVSAIFTIFAKKKG